MLLERRQEVRSRLTGDYIKKRGRFIQRRGKGNLGEVAGLPGLMAIKLDEGGAVLRRTKYTGPCFLEIKAGEELERGVVKRCIELEFDWNEGVQSAGEVTLG